MKTCVSSFSFSRLIKSGKITQLDAMRRAKEMGFDAFELASVTPHDGLSVTEYAKMLRREADAMDFPIVSFVDPSDLINGREGRSPDEEVEYVKSMVDIAEILGASVMRHDATYALKRYKSFDTAVPELAEKISEISEYARTKGIKTCIENHGKICQDPDRVERLYNAVTSDNFGVLCDIGNFLCCDFDPVTSVSLVAPYTVFVHIKDFILHSGALDPAGEGYKPTRGENLYRSTILGHGNIPFKQCLRILKNAGYDGYCSVEFNGIEDPFDALPICLANLKGYFAEI